MTTVKTVIYTSAIVLTALICISCKDGTKKVAAVPMGNEMHHEDRNDMGNPANNDARDSRTTAILDGYLSIKNALVADNTDEAAEAGGKLVAALDNFDVSAYSSSEQTQLKDIIVDAKEQAEHISESPMEHQREHLKTLSTDVTDMVAIIGTDKKLYEQFCPMYENGSTWLSASNEVKNPYYGSKMVDCGKIQQEIN
ncbi:Protein of unknown function [Pricia antarctica]|uniref:DUF3347 domain-containing protein n=1 Tax=Pricia antarctica TaxID=641691 RepID=A0A1G7AIK3_9FLAO|nr:DUF3347 domain-containing protein [Pricia antarctica]SDE14602.1 Protein of unknown function [Pricia antarctica]